MSALSQPVVQRSGIERRTRVRVISTICLVIIVCGLVLLSAMVGQYRVEAADVIKIVFGRSATDAMAESVLWQIRFPRIVLGLLVGASLAVAGAVMQALFSNPLAEPGVIGVSSGAAVGASIMIVVAPNFFCPGSGCRQRHLCPDCLRPVRSTLWRGPDDELSRRP